MTSTPLFADAWQCYVAAGWSGVLVLPPARKEYPPTGYTGAEGQWPTRQRLERWANETPDGNIALRMPRDVIGIDIDAYKDDTVRARLEAVTGTLPPTWCSTSRVDGSGIRLYRVPVPPVGTVWVNSPVPGVEIIQHHHRYAVVAPSLHPEGRRYRWVDESSGEVCDDPPQIDDLTELPWQAVRALTVQREPERRRDATGFEITKGAMSATVERRLRNAVDNTRGDAGSRHDAACRDVLALLRYAERGEPGVESAIAQLRDAFVRNVGPDRAPGKAEREFDDIVRGGLRRVESTEGRIPTKAERDAEASGEWFKVLPPPQDATTGATGAADGPRVDHLAPLNLLDWRTFWTQQSVGADWLVEPLIARGRSHAFYAGAKSGKSLLMLAACAAIATGRPFLNNPARPPQHILYLDYEMTEEDVRERLEGFGYGPDDDLSHFHYALLPAVAPLDSEMGAAVVITAAETFSAVHVVIDTMSRAVAGDENEAQTVRDFYRYTGLQLKARGIGYHRLDHSGKDPTKGQRGTSAKNDDVDVVQQLIPRDKGAVTVKATHRRMSWVPEVVDISVEDSDGVLVYSTKPTVHPTGTFHIVEWLDAHDVPVELGRPAVRAMLKEAGFAARNDALTAALKVRRDRVSTLGQLLGQRQMSHPGSGVGTVGTETQNSRSEHWDSVGDSAGQHPAAMGAVSVSIDTDSPRPTPARPILGPEFDGIL